MTKLLERAIALGEACANAQLKTLSDQEQDAIAFPVLISRSVLRGVLGRSRLGGRSQFFCQFRRLVQGL